MYGVNAQEGGGADVPESAPRRPRYYPVKQHLAALADRLPAGSPVPTERALAEEFGTSRTTVRQAIAELVVEGRLERTQGSGTFVARPKLVRVRQLTSFTDDMAAQGHQPGARLLELVSAPAEPEVAARLGLAPDARVTRVSRVRTADGVPMALETSNLPSHRFPRLGRALDRAGSLYAAMRDGYGVVLAEVEDSVETALASPEEAELLGVDVGLPMLLVQRTAFDADGQPVEFTRSLYRGDRFRFVARAGALGSARRPVPVDVPG